MERLGDFLSIAIKTSAKLTNQVRLTFAVVMAASIGRGLTAAGIISQEQLERIPAAWAVASDAIAAFFNAGLSFAGDLMDGIVEYLKGTQAGSALINGLKGLFSNVTGLGIVSSLFSVVPGAIPGALAIKDILGGSLYQEDLPTLPGDVPTMFDPSNFQRASGNTYIQVNGALDPISVGNQIIDIINTNNNRLGYPGGVLT